MVELTNDDLKCISTFEELTGASVRDCIIAEDAITFIVAEGDLGKAIGKKGANITRVRQAFGRQVLVFEDSEQMEKFVRSLFAPIAVTNINVHDKMDSKTIYVHVDERDRGTAIGKGGNRIKLARTLVQRKFNCDLRLATH
ncbi:KH domain protein [Candidatus Anstonella stagnisolia]|nr:KH domain protein [Candidatus Anstonella stagnisolia]